LSMLLLACYINYSNYLGRTTSWRTSLIHLPQVHGCGARSSQFFDGRGVLELARVVAPPVVLDPHLFRGAECALGSSKAPNSPRLIFMPRKFVCSPVSLIPPGQGSRTFTSCSPAKFRRLLHERSDGMGRSKPLRTSTWPGRWCMPSKQRSTEWQHVKMKILKRKQRR
jgi:hypothetical protein